MTETNHLTFERFCQLQNVWNKGSNWTSTSTLRGFKKNVCLDPQRETFDKLCHFFSTKQPNAVIQREATLNTVKPHSYAYTLFMSVLILSEELRSEITQDACMCEAQIVFQKKVQSTIQELSRKHILLPLAKMKLGRITDWVWI